MFHVINNTWYITKSRTQFHIGLESVSLVKIFQLLENLMFTMNANNSNLDNESLKNNSAYNTQFYHTFGIIHYVLTSLTLICIFIGNALTISAIIKFRWLRNKTNYVLFSLAIADIFVGLTTLSRMIFENVTEHINCDVKDLAILIISIFGTMAYETSALHIVTIAWERHLAVTKPFVYHCMTTRKLSVAIALPWLISGSIAIIIFGVTGYLKLYNTCDNNDRTLWLFIDLIINVTLYLLGAIIVVTMYIRVLKVLSRHNKDILTMTYNDPERREVISKTEIRATKMLALVIIAYLISWLPHFSLRVILSSFQVEHKLSWGLSQAGVFIGFNNSAINVLLYAVSHRDFKKAYTCLITCKKENQHQHNDTSKVIT